MKPATVVAVLTMCIVAAGQNSSVSKEYPSPLIREEQQVTVDGATETWRLVWSNTPKPRCDAHDELSLTCPCIGFAYGEIGDLFLARIREGKEVDRLRLTPLFPESKGAILQRWAADDDKDSKAIGNESFPTSVKKRPIVRIMNFADYDHDGQKTEFYLQTSAGPCGKTFGAVIGLSKKTHRLHAFGTVTHPTKPLLLQGQEWDSLKNASEPVELVDWPCYDHGAETETKIRLYWSPDGIDGRIREYSCQDQNPGAKKEPQRLLKEGPLSSQR